MRSSEDVFLDIERDRSVREAEVRLIENIIARTTNEDEQRMLRRSLVLLTYAHLEGFCKFALGAYAAAVNALKLPCSSAATPLVALTLTRVFSALHDVNRKHPAFAKLADDKDVHRLAREHAFIENYNEIVLQRVEIPDTAIDTQSNLNTLVLKRNLYQLGLSYPIVDTHGGSINMLLGVRNAIAHGDLIKEPKASEATTYVKTAFEVMSFVQNEVYEALQNRTYERERDTHAAFL